MGRNKVEVVVFPRSEDGVVEERTLSDAYADWLLTPKEYREPPTQRAFAEQWRVSEETLRSRRKEVRFQRDMQAKARGLVRSEKLPDLLQALYGQALDPTNPRSVAAAKVLLEFSATAANEKAPVDLSQVPEEELVEAAMKVLAAASGRSHVEG